ncbi:GreA/GreB family elongation factor [Sphingosinicella sp.]|uniref:GreA/GreB family elongation factor n=1 Tax=Sphingosinicella sp. TaxID=1917971 RepID=UPI004037FAD5
MSVAFRRERDEEHKEPRFELPIPPGPNLVTAAGLALTEAKVAALEAAVAAESDTERRAPIERELRYWRTRLATAELAPPPPADEAAFGSRVTFRLNGETRVFAIVGDDEADPANGKIAFSAPLARALIGAGPGDFSDFGGKVDAIEVISVAAIED